MPKLNWYPASLARFVLSLDRVPFVQSPELLNPSELICFMHPQEVDVPKSETGRRITSRPREFGALKSQPAKNRFSPPGLRERKVATTDEEDPLHRDPLAT